MFPSSWKKYPFPGRSNRDTRTHMSSSQNFSLNAPDCTFSSRKMKKAVRGRGDTPLPPLLRSLGLVLLPRKDCAPPNVLAHYATDSYESIQLKTDDTKVTGTHITATTSVSVIVGCACAFIPTAGTGFCDVIIEQLLPFDRWGHSFILTPFYNRPSGYVFQVLVGRNNTNITLMTGRSVEFVKLHMSEYKVTNVTAQIMYFLQADRPISVMQYSKCCCDSSGTSGDPAMLRLPPLQHYVRNATFPVFKFEGGKRKVSVYIAITKSSACDRHNITLHHNHLPYKVIKV